MRVLSTDLSPHIGERVTLAGWLHAKRELGAVSFVLVRDRAGLAQAVVDGTLDLRPETVLEVEGLAVTASQAPGGVELQEPTFSVVAEPMEATPVELRRPVLKETLPTILDHAAVALRHPRERAKFQIAAASLAGFRRALDGLGFVEISTPKIVASATETGANLFSLDYFGRPAFLAQSPQLYKQMLVGVFERVFEVGPVFRAEPHDTPRHLNEYVSLDAELGFIADHREVMAVLETAITAMAQAASVHGAARQAGVRLPVRVPSRFPVLHFTAALDLLATELGPEVRSEPDLAPAHERRLGEWALRTHGSDFLFVVGFPMRKRPFYTHPDPERPAYSNSFDLLFRGLELATGGQRLHRYDDYEAALRARRIEPAPFAGYLEAFRYGMPPHGGFAIGLERWVQQLVGASNLRETTLF